MHSSNLHNCEWIIIFWNFARNKFEYRKKKKSGRIIKERDRESTHRDKAASETNQPPPTSIDPLPFLTIHRVSIYLFLFFVLFLPRTEELVGRIERKWRANVERHRTVDYSISRSIMSPPLPFHPFFVST